jgi:hypothetical protein
MQTVVVFLGPSLDPDAARAILDATFRPPAKRGDLTAAVADGAAVIGLIDGVFFQDSAVGHREILAALRRGVRVIGASSMGALRAAEMESFGMEGIGEIYRRYASGELVADDEVALVFDPYTGIALSEPLVNIRYALELAERAGVLDEGECRALFDVAAGLYYPDRTYRRIAAEAASVLGDEAVSRFLAFVEIEKPDLKRKDAVRALTYLRETMAGR